MSSSKRARKKKSAKKSTAASKRKAAKKKKFEHRGYVVEVTEDRERPRARIAGKTITVTPSKKGKKLYATPYLPYRQSSSVEELARAVVDHSAEFETKE